MGPSSPDKPTEPIVVQPTPAVYTSELFQKDVVPVLPSPKQNLFARIGNKKLLVAGLALGMLILISGIAYAQLSRSGSKLPTDQPLTENQSEESVSNTQSGDLPQGASEQQTPSDGSSSTPSNTTTQSTTGTSGGSSSGGTGSTTPPSSGSGSTQTAPKTYEISYTDSCYSPANVTIKKNDTVRFTNNNTKNMWPASDNHPWHTLYSGFDANNSIAPGGSYSFTFTKTGSWGYHDHQKSSCTGTITVQ
ncbi:MAG: hypothetical protein V4702_03135 [Patescibacteria group bacterium]